jgi:hypothetical protein
MMQPNPDEYVMPQPQPQFLPTPQPQQDSPVMLNQQSNETIKWLEETADIVKQIEMTLLNQEIYEDEDGELRIRDKEGTPYMNKLGVNQTISLVTSHFHRGITLSNFTDLEIVKTMRILHVKIALLLGRNRETFAIEKGNLHTIIEIITNIIHATFKRAGNEGERVMFGRTHSTSETHMTQPPAQQKKLFGIIPI